MPTLDLDRLGEVAEPEIADADLAACEESPSVVCFPSAPYC